MPIVLLLACLFAASTVAAGETIATPSWRYEAPAGWSTDPSASPARSTGPDGELVLFSSYSIAAGSAVNEARRALESLMLDTMREEASGPGLRVKVPLTTKAVSPVVTIHELASETTDGQEILVQFTVVGPRAVVLITYEASSPGSSLEHVRRSIQAMDWTMQGNSN